MLSPAPKPSKRLAEVKIDKAQQDFARLQNVVVKKQAELQQADERANCKAKEVRERSWPTLAKPTLAKPTLASLFCYRVWPNRLWPELVF